MSVSGRRGGAKLASGVLPSLNTLTQFKANPSSPRDGDKESDDSASSWIQESFELKSESHRGRMIFWPNWANKLRLKGMDEFQFVTGVNRGWDQSEVNAFSLYLNKMLEQNFSSTGQRVWWKAILNPRKPKTKSTTADLSKPSGVIRHSRIWVLLSPLQLGFSEQWQKHAKSFWENHSGLPDFTHWYHSCIL